MSKDLKGEQCSICHAYLFEEDDVVYCPVCGAPHHRDCYQSIGHCGLEELHGTDRQYDLLKTEPEIPQEPPVHHRASEAGVQKCGMCGEEYESNSRTCPRCGAPNLSGMNGAFGNFDFLGGVPAELELGDGVTADEAKRFVMTNTHRYIPKFAGMKLGGKTSWNWLAFLFPCGWAFSRKMYRNGFLIAMLSVALMLPIQSFYFALMQTVQPDSAVNSAQMFELLMQNYSTVSKGILILGTTAAFLFLLFRILIGVFSDNIYRHHVLQTTAKLKLDSEDLDEDFRRKGGVSLLGLILGYAIEQYAPILLFQFIM